MKIIQPIINSFLVWWLRSGRYRWSWLRRRLFERRYLNVALPSASSLEEIEACLKQVTWTLDGPLHLFDCISYPQVTWAKKKDDCDGFSSLAAELLKRWNPDYHPVLLTVMCRPVAKSHTVCVFAGPQGNLCFFDNHILHREGYQKYEDIAKKISEKTEKLLCWDVRDPATLNMLEFHA